MGMFGNKGGKSGDSARADEEAARKKDASADAGNETPVEKNEALPTQVQASVDRAKEDGAGDERVRFLEAQLEKLTNVVEALQSKVARGGTGSGKLDGRTPEELLPKHTVCGQCGQWVVVCRGKHRTARVLPLWAENMEGFPGVKINGVNYFGVCIVPAASYDTIMGCVSNFETMKRHERHDRGKIRGWDREVALAAAQVAVRNDPMALQGA